MLKPQWLLPAIALWAVAAVIAPATIVGRFLPAEYDQYRLHLVQGFWLLKGMLFVDGFLWLALPLAMRAFTTSPRTTINVPPPAVDHGVPRTLDWLLIGAITTLAGVVRLYHLGAGLGYDEIYVSTTMYQRNFAGLIARADTHRLFYGLWAWLTCHLAGPLEVAARAPALLFGVATVPILYLCVRRLVGRREGLIAALLLAVSTLHIWYSQEATSYTLAFLFAVLSTTSFYRCMSTAAPRPWMAWAIVAFLTIFSHFFVGLLLLFGQTLFGAWSLVRGAASVRSAGRFLLATTYIAAAFLTFTSITFFRYLDALLDANGRETRGPLEENLVFLGAWVAGTYASQAWQIVYGVATVCGTAMLARRDSRLTLYLWLPTLSVLVLFIVGIMGFITPRYFILALIPTTICVATAVVAIVDALTALARGPSQVAIRAGAYALAIAALLYGAGESLSAYFAQERYPFHPVAEYLDENAAPTEKLLFGGYGFDKFKHYAPQLEWSHDYDELRTTLDAGKPFWLVYYMPEYLERMPPDLRSRLETNGKFALYYEGFPDQLITQYEGFVWHVGQSASEPRTADAVEPSADVDEIQLQSR